MDKIVIDPSDKEKLFAALDQIIEITEKEFEREVLLILPNKFVIEHEEEFAERITWDILPEIVTDFRTGHYHQEGKPDMRCIRKSNIDECYIIPIEPAIQYKYCPYSEYFNPEECPPANFPAIIDQ